MVGAEGFEVSFRSGRFAFSSVGFRGKTVGIQRFSEILRLAPLFPILLPMDRIPQEVGITGITPPLGLTRSRRSCRMSLFSHGGGGGSRPENALYGDVQSFPRITGTPKLPPQTCPTLVKEHSEVPS